MVKVPLVTIDASPQFVTEALRSTGVIGNDTAVAEVEHDQIGEGVGLMCSLARLTLRYAGTAAGAPSSVVMKVPSSLPENRGVGDHFNFYAREGRFYEQIGAAIAVRTPDCYFNHIDEASNEFLLILEDFGGRTMVSQIAGINFERAAEATRAIARVHAQWWATPALEGLSWMPTLRSPPNDSAGEQYRKAWPAFVDLLGGGLPPGSIDLGERVGASFEQVQADLIDSSPPTLCHGDFRADNLMFDDSATGRQHVGVLDWQIAMRSAGIGDVAYLITQSMTAEDRRAHDRALVEIWYDALSAELGQTPATYTLEDAWDGYRASTATMTVYSVVSGGQLDPANERGRELVHDMSIRAFSAALDLGAVAFLAT
jgi:hypothetical protein